VATVAHFGGWINTAAVKEGYAFVCQANAFTVLNLADPQPQPVAFLNFPQELGEIFIAGNYAYVAYWAAAGVNTFEVVEIADPLQPVRRGALNLTGFSEWGSVTGIHVSGDYAYLATEIGLKIINVTNPAAPALAGSSASIAFRSVAVAGNYAYLVDSTGRLRAFNVTNPASPTAAGSVALSADKTEVAVAGNYAYVIGNGMTIVNVTNPQSLTAASSFGAGTIFRFVSVLGNRAYLSAGDWGQPQELRIVDVTNPASPTQVGALTLASQDEGGTVQSLHVQVVSGSTFAYAAMGGVGRGRDSWSST
jgi:hypothetical protein